MGGTCNYFIALKIPELLVSVYRARARQGRKLEPLALASTAQQSRIGPGCTSIGVELAENHVKRMEAFYLSYFLLLLTRM